MAKKRRDLREEERERQSRKEILLARKQAKQMRQIRIGVGIVVTLLVLVFLVAVVNEFFISPNRAVATVNGENITLRQWQERVRYERAQRVILLQNQLETFNNDMSLVQQFGGQLILEMDPRNAESLGQDVLNQMIDEVAIRQAAEARGIVVTDEDVEKAIRESFNFFDGALPTPMPTATATVMPTPSLTPIPTAVITDVVPTATPAPTQTPGPTSTPFPTATPVTLEAYQEQLSEFIGQFEELGVSEAVYREVVRARLYRQRLMDALAEEENLPTEAEHASIFLMAFGTEEEANEALAMVKEQGFLTVWNTIRSTPFDPESGSTAVATEFLWRTHDDFASALGAEVADKVFELPLNTASEILQQELDDGTIRYYIIQVSGRELRPLSEAALQAQKQQLLATFVDQQLTGNLVITDYWRGRTPTQPVLPPEFFVVQPTPTPFQLVPPSTDSEATPPADE
ncbi:MAG: hypothetical protein D6706_11050 [Chloroflexi bacterium]|nr:MAG: hypothetical protein D6706_11050 [Chloroflexota bacterium]